jgi:hypothetical protein
VLAPYPPPGIPGITNQTIVSLALGSGAIGPGSPISDAADQLQARLETSVTTKFETLFADDWDAVFQNLVETTRAAQMLGIESFPPGVSPASIQIGPVAPDVGLSGRVPRGPFRRSVRLPF